MLSLGITSIRGTDSGVGPLELKSPVYPLGVSPQASYYLSVPHFPLL